MSRDSAFRALADPTRRRILELLAESDRTAGEIAQEFPMAFATVSHHLAVLKSARLVAVDREGQRMRYRINTAVHHEIARYLMNLFAGRHA